MNKRRIIFWSTFFIIIGLIVWGMIVAMNKQPIGNGTSLGTPSEVNINDAVRGPSDAPVTLIEFSDFQCPACAIYFSAVEKLYMESSTTLRVVYRHFPLPQHANADLAARASEAAKLQGKFWEMHDELFMNQDTWAESPKPMALFEQYGTKIGLDLIKFRIDIDSAGVKDKVLKDLNEARLIGINSTPTFFINGKSMENPTNYEEFKKNIEDAIASGTK